MNNEIIISNVNPQDIFIGEGGAAGITDVLVNGSSVVENNIAYVVVPTKLSELQNDTHYISQETDPTVPYVVKQITLSDINRWNSKQEQLISGVNIKTINNNSILGEGNINVDKTYTAGTGINITEENVINNTITSYNDLNDLPTIPTKISDLQNDSDFVESSELSNVAFSGSYLDLSNTPDLSLYATLDTNELLNYYTKDFFFKILPKVSGGGTSITLNDTIENAQMYLTLSPSELSQDGTPTPSSPQDIHTISGSNKVKVIGKNYFHIESVTPISSYYMTYEKINDNKIIINLTNAGVSYRYVTIPVEVEANTTYYFKAKTTSTNSNMTTLWFGVNSGDGSTTLYNNSYTSEREISFNTGANTTIKVFLYTNGGQQGENTATWENIQLTTNANDDFEPYTSQEADIDLGDIEYCKIGNYEDKIFKNIPAFSEYDSNLIEGAWYIKKNIPEKVFDGSEAWSLTTATHDGFTRFSVSAPAIKGQNLALCNYFVVNDTTSTSTTNLLEYRNTNYIFINTDVASIVEDFKTWLSTHNLKVRYVANTPTYTQITGTLAEQLENVYQKMLSQKGVTNISQVNNDLPFVISAVTLKDMSNL